MEGSENPKNSIWGFIVWGIKKGEDTIVDGVEGVDQDGNEGGTEVGSGQHPEKL